MPEIKHVFTAGKMNKDLDERFVPNGQYRDALNIQVRTSEDGDSGIITSIEGNTVIKSSLNYDFPGQFGGACVGSIADEANNKAYFFFSGPEIDGQGPASWVVPIGYALQRYGWSNRIIEYDAVDNCYYSVFNDVYAVTCVTNSPNTYITPPVAPTTGYSTLEASPSLAEEDLRPGCLLQMWDNNNAPLFQNPPTVVSVINNTIVLDTQYFDDLTNAQRAAFWWPRVLEFSPGNQITGINIIDDFLLWTDGQTEPKKINIKRCKAGTVADGAWVTNSFGIPASKHTKLMVENGDGDLTPINEIETQTDEYIKKEHITVLRPAPRKAPKIEMSSSTRSGVVKGEILNQQFSSNGVPFESGSIVNDVQIGPQGISLIEGDYVLLKNDQSLIEPKTIRAHVVSDNGPLSNGTQSFDLQVNNVPSDILDSDNQWDVELEQKKPMFELSLGRFAYRYKYEDGEYSAISPWSELAFLPDEFAFEPKNGHNLGMVNTVRDLKITDFVSSDLTRPDDVTEVEILYKKAREAICYVVRTIKRDIDPEWNVQTNAITKTKGAIQITSEMIHRPLPSDQTLRAWDAVPRHAKAQTITGGRVVYGNYTQNYDVPRFALKQSLFSRFDATVELPKKSIKSLRKYKIGVVFGDKYGRETPVQEVGAEAKYIPSTQSYEFTPSELSVEKSESGAASKLHLTQSWLTPQGQSILPPDWMDYYKYYVKEISSEYYNLPMDRWYEAEDGNIWLSFYSHDRNKLDEETYIILKNQHGNQIAVEQEARYKVLAIQNEAPTFIKADGWTIGSVSPVVNVDADFDTEAAFVNATSITVSADDYNGLIGNIQTSGNAIRYARLVAETTSFTHRSRYVRIANTSQMVNGGNGMVNLSEAFGPSADFTEIWSANSYDEPLTDDSFSLEFKQEEITNKPEFEGRFFVKIHRDDALDTNVLNETGAQDAFWSTINAFNYTYLAFGNYSNAWDFTNNNSPNPGVNGSAGNQPYHNYIIGVTPMFDSNGDGTLDSNPHYDNFLVGDCGWDFGNWDQSDYNANNDHHINKFAHCPSADETRAFWLNWNTHKSTTWFIDECRFAPMMTTPSGSSNTSLPTISTTTNSALDEWITNDEGEPFHSRGLYNSGDTGDHDMLFFGCKDRYSELSTADKNFADTMQTDGTYFMFRDDPNETKYRVTDSSGTKTILAWQKQNCDDCNSSHASCVRTTFWIKFRRVNDATASITASGLDVSVWDPRSVVTHDGQIKSTIEIVAPFAQQTTESSTITGNAVWETEPKEAVDIDLYYEASNALPLRLNSKNIVDFAPLGSLVGTKKGIVNFTNNNYIETQSVIPNAIVTDHVYGAIEFKEFDGNSETLTGEGYSKFLIGDEVTLTHSDGVETNVVIKNYLQKNNESSAYPPIPTSSVEAELTFIPSSEGGDSNVLTYSLAPLDNAVLSFLYTQTGLGNDILIESSSSSLLNIPVGTYVLTQGGANNPVIDQTTGSITLTDNLSIATVGTGGGVPLEVQGGLTSSITLRAVTGLYEVESEVYENPVKLAWHNCYSFGNGVESNRIRDDFNAQYIDNGAKASTVLENYGEENLASGMIYSGLYNSTTGLNALNEFNTAVQITKNLNPAYGSIQALKTRDTNVLAFCEDKVLKILANKDAVFNADGNPQLTATNRVLGQTIPFAGDYGISKNPESLAEDQFRYYFTDKQRGAVLRLSNDGLTPISNVGMRDFFQKNLRVVDSCIGTFDTVAGEYNLTMLLNSKNVHSFVDTGQVKTIGNATDFYLKGQTITFNEAAKGWISFKSFIPSSGISVSGRYLTTGIVTGQGEKQKPWMHYNGDLPLLGLTFYNNFYGVSDNSYVDVVFNDDPSTVKTFMALSYEGSQQHIDAYTQSTVVDAAGNTLSNLTDGEYYNLSDQKGWYVESITTDMQTGSLKDFIEKENKYFGYIRGADSGADGSASPTDDDLKEFSFQGIGEASAVTAAGGGAYSQTDFNFTIQGS